MLYLLYRFGTFLAKILPIKACYFLAKVAGLSYYIFAWKDRKILRENLKVVLGENSIDSGINCYVREVFINFAKYLADFFKFEKFTHKYIDENIVIEGRGFIDECLKEGRGLIIIAIHFGNWELGGAILSALGYPLHGIVLEHADKRVDDFFVHQRFMNGLRSIPVSGHHVIKESLKVLRNNEILAIVGDKDYTSGGIDIDFFGKKTLIPKGPAVFSIRTGAPIVFGVFIRKGNDKFKLHFEAPIRFKPTGNYNEDVDTLMKEYLRLFERSIRENPGQWYAFKRLWNQR